MAGARPQDLGDVYDIETLEQLIPGWELYRPISRKCKWKWRAKRQSTKDESFKIVEGSLAQTAIVKALLTELAD